MGRTTVDEGVKEKGRAKEDASFFGTESIWKILRRIAPPVMLAQLIQAIYNIVDSFFVGKYSQDGLTALSIIFPIQLIIIALAVGTGVGVNTQISRLYAHGWDEEAKKTKGTGIFLAGMSWLIFAIVAAMFMRPYVCTSAKSAEAIDYAVTYGIIVCVGSIGVFYESIFSKIHQAGGNMKLPMMAQIAGAVINVILDPVLIFGWGFIPKMGIAGAAIATIIGQIVAAVITGVTAFYKPPKVKEILHYSKEIYKLGYPSIFMQMLYTIYIVVLNVILSGFSDEAVTVLGLYYKIQTFFFIPLIGLQTCIVPVLSYNCASRKYERCKKIMNASVFIASSFMVIGMLCFEFIPDQLIRIFSKDLKTLEIGINAFRIIGISFIPAVFSLMMPVFFQAIGNAAESVVLSLTRQIFCLIPIFWIFSKIGLNYTWIAFPAAEIITGGVGILLYVRQIRKWKSQ